ncbi:Replication factor C subunit [Hortaea werneckii]|nr:Replication factor C subunit [Hortaea werneckii]
MLATLKLRSRIVRCSSLPSTNLLSTSEKMPTIRAFCQSCMTSSPMTIFSYSCVTTVDADQPSATRSCTHLDTREYAVPCFEGCMASTSPSIVGSGMTPAISSIELTETGGDVGAALSTSIASPLSSSSSSLTVFARFRFLSF